MTDKTTDETPRSKGANI